MEWALVRQRDAQFESVADAYGLTFNEVMSRLPQPAHEEFRSLILGACRDGQQRRLNISQATGLYVLDIVPVTTAPAQPIALILLRDVDEFDSTRDRLSRLARRNDAILRCSMDGFFVVNSDFRFLEVNDAFCRMVGYTADELLHLRVTDLEVIDSRAEQLPAHQATGLHHFPTAHRHKRGHIVHLEISVNVLHDSGARILVGFARDVTERLAAEAELARLTREQRLILDSAADGIAGLDAQGRFTLLNPAALHMLRATEEELIGRPLGDIVHNQAAPREQLTSDAIRAVLAGELESASREAEFERPDGSRFPVSFSITTMKMHREAVGAVLVFNDLTAQREAETRSRELAAQVQAAQRLESLGLLAGGLAHDLNNVLTGIQGNAALAMRELPADSSIRRRIERIVASCERASGVIDQVLTSAGRKTIELRPVDLNELTGECLELVRPRAAAGVTWDLDCDSDAPLISADAGQLEQVITNLLINALESLGGEPGAVRLTTRRIVLGRDELTRLYPGQKLEPGAFVELTVADTGCGIEPEALARIFDPFYTSKATGRGLGLSAMRGVVRAHGGGVRVESEPNVGSRFGVIFPAASSNAPSESENPAPQPPRILVVDDDDGVRDVVQDVLEGAGFIVETAVNGEMGLERFRTNPHRFDAVLLDLVMPGKSGGQVLREMRELHRDVKVIVVTGYSDELHHARPRDMTPDGLIQKPFINEELIEQVNEVVGRRVLPDAESVDRLRS